LAHETVESSHRLLRVLLSVENITQKKKYEMNVQHRNMRSKSDQTETALSIMDKRGRSAVEKARLEILSLPYDGGVVSSALRYYADVTLPSVLPLFPTLISIACEASGGKNEKTEGISAAIMLITAAGDIHDDVIDKSKTKYSRKTVFGEFDYGTTILAGDALLVQGLTLLHRECEALTRKQRQSITMLIPEAFFEIGKGEAEEIQLMKKTDVTPREYFEVIRLKGAVAEAMCRIGGILGDADEETLESLSYYGRTIGILSTIKDEFGDIKDTLELQHRMLNECPPLPMLYAFQDPQIQSKVKMLTKNSKLTKKDAKKIAEIILNSEKVQELTKEMHQIVNKELESFLLKHSVVKTDAELLLRVMLECL
jgi:geranylgeranyl pyrophosphate synthase